MECLQRMMVTGHVPGCEGAAGTVMATFFWLQETRKMWDCSCEILCDHPWQWKINGKSLISGPPATIFTLKPLKTSIHRRFRIAMVITDVHISNL